MYLKGNCLINVVVVEEGLMTMNQVYVEISDFPPVVADPHRPPLQDQDYALVSVVGSPVEVVVVVVVVVRDVMIWRVVVVVADCRK